MNPDLTVYLEHPARTGNKAEIAADLLATLGRLSEGIPNVRGCNVEHLTGLLSVAERNQRLFPVGK